MNRRRLVVVVEKPERWTLDLDLVDVVSARDYLSGRGAGGGPVAQVFNLCRSYRYRSIGYYVSLLAEARGHRPVPDVATIQDLKSQANVRRVSEELDKKLQSSLRPINSDRFTLSVYFGRNLAARHDALARGLFALFPMPLLRAEMRRDENGVWQIASLRALALEDVPDSHRDFLARSARQYFGQRRRPRRTPKSYRFDLALLVDPEAKLSPSNEGALRKIEKHGQRLGLWVERIGKDDLPRLLEFDALLIRETTLANHYTYRFARRAAAAGMVVIDDPESILRCTNKVFLTELLARHEIPTPRSLVVHRDNIDEIEREVGLPAVLKLPDGSFSQAVVKAADAEACRTHARRFLEESDLLLAQEYLPTAFDWRLGVLDRKPLFAARYHMARGHWQIARHSTGSVRYGDVEAVPLAEVPPEVVEIGLRAAGLIGDGFYGVDLKETPRGVVVIEINDNPNLDAGEEDVAEGDVIYETLLEVFVRRLEQKKRGDVS